MEIVSHFGLSRLHFQLPTSNKRSIWHCFYRNVWNLKYIHRDCGRVGMSNPRALTTHNEGPSHMAREDVRPNILTTKKHPSYSKSCYQNPSLRESSKLQKRDLEALVDLVLQRCSEDRLIATTRKIKRNNNYTNLVKATAMGYPQTLGHSQVRFLVGRNRCQCPTWGVHKLAFSSSPRAPPGHGTSNRADGN